MGPGQLTRVRAKAKPRAKAEGKVRAKRENKGNWAQDRVWARQNLGLGTRLKKRLAQMVARVTEARAVG